MADVGGVPYLVPGPAAWRERTYNFNHVAKQTDVPGAHVLGACAGSKHYVQVNSGKYYRLWVMLNAEKFQKFQDHFCDFLSKMTI